MLIIPYIIGTRDCSVKIPSDGSRDIVRMLFHSLIIPILAITVIMAGCGGGSGGSVTGVDPLELEIAAILDAFAVQVSNQNLDGSMEFIDSNIQYFPKTKPGFEGFTAFRNKLKLMFDNTASVNLSFPSSEYSISVESERYVVLTGTLVCTFHDLQGAGHEIREQCEIHFEHVQKWGIKTLSGRLQTGLQFPEVL